MSPASSSQWTNSNRSMAGPNRTGSMPAWPPKIPCSNRPNLWLPFNTCKHPFSLVCWSMAMMQLKHLSCTQTIKTGQNGNASKVKKPNTSTHRLQQSLGVPIPKVLVPFPLPTDAGFLQHDLGVEEIRFYPTNESLRRTDQRPGSTKRRVRVFAQMKPQCEFGRSSGGVLHGHDLFVDRRVLFDGVQQQLAFLRWKEGFDTEVAVGVEGVNL